MPITVISPSGVLTAAGRRRIIPRLTEALIEASGQNGNEFLSSIIGGAVHVMEPSDIYAGGTNRPVVMVELKLPDIGLPDPAARAVFITAATEIVDEMTVEGHDRENTWVNIVNAPDGGWGIGGVAYSGEGLVAAISQSS
jgi:phenylpyruvate tautomerase PptA (4-oxalocrotonate tautomerase family)